MAPHYKSFQEKAKRGLSDQPGSSRMEKLATKVGAIRALIERIPPENLR
jgi:hypothetical protein